ncbi:MAG: hypothetical protein GEV10_10090 [Streptosporangiales bacterium]|nr:hypothetical protein [Streptosporangiales bacterium]
MRGFLRDNALTLFFLVALVLALVGQAISGWSMHNDEQLASAGATVSLLQYLTSSSFAVDIAENWQSEFLQFYLYVFVTVWLVQRGSPESKPPGKEGRETDEEQRVGAYATAESPRWAAAGGWRRAVFSRSLGIVMGVVFLLSWVGQSVAGRAAYNADQLASYQDPVTWVAYVASTEFWNRTLQNWQSEFLAVASMAAFSIYLRQRGSPESKPVGTSHAMTGIGG